MSNGMKFLVGLTATVMAMQIAFDMMVVDSIIHGEVAWRLVVRDAR